MADPTHHSSGRSDAILDGNRPGNGATSLSFPSGASLTSLRGAIWSYRRYRASFVAHVAVSGTWPLLFPFMAVAATLASTHAAGGALEGLPVVLVAIASGAPKLVMIVALESGLAFARCCHAASLLATALVSLVVGLLADAAVLSVAFVESGPVAERVMWQYLPVVTVLSGGASLLLVATAIGRVARTIGAPRLARRARRVQALGTFGGVAVPGAFAAWMYLSATVATVLGIASLGACLAAAVLHFVLAGDLFAALLALLEERASANRANASDESGPARRTDAWRKAMGFIGLAAACAFGTGLAVSHGREARTNVLLLHAVDREAVVVGERCGDRGSRLPVAPLEVSHQTDDSTSDPTLTLTAKGEVFHRRRLVARISGACALDPQGGVLVSVDTNGLIRGPGREAFGAFKAVQTLKASGARVAVGEVLVGPDRGMTGIADDGSVYFVAPPPDDAEHRGNDEEAVSLPAEVKGAVSLARRTALLLDALVGRLDPTDR